MNYVLTVVVDNVAEDSRCQPEHGLSMWLEAGGEGILFDTGAGGAFLGNAEALGIPLDRTSALVLSHGHYDHTSGVADVLERGRVSRIFMHPEVLRPRYRRMESPPHKPIGMRPEIADQLSNRPEIIPATQPMQIAPGVWLTGPIPRRTAFEDVGGPFFRDEECLVPDPLPDDQALWLNTAEGVVVVLGCAHSGVVNTLQYISELTAASSFRAVVGGMHLMEASSLRLTRTAEALLAFQVALLAPCHCTGDNAAGFLQQRLPGQYRPIGAGRRFEFRM